MRLSLLDWLRDPRTGDRLDAHAFAERIDPAGGERDIVEGLLVALPSGNTYAITQGVPVMLADGLPAEFCACHSHAIEELRGRLNLQIRTAPSSGFSFSQEWETHWRQKAVRTWGWTLQERVEQFFLETETDPAVAAGRWMLDAGCGSGQLSQAIAEQGLNVIAIDLGTGVFFAERHRTSPRVHYVQGNLLSPPFAASVFDVVFSQGVLHHTPNTLAAFNSVGQLVRRRGKFFLWLYHWPRTFVQGWLKQPIVELARMIICRLPMALQRRFVELYTRVLCVRNAILRRRGAPAPNELLIDMYDMLTPRYRHYHTPFEVAEWFYRLGFTAPRLTHWDNPLGFGMMAKREPLPATPGLHYASTLAPGLASSKDRAALAA